MIMYYAKFVPNVSTLLAPLYNLLKIGVKYVWGEQCQRAFEELKSRLVSSEVLCHYSAELPLVLTADASSVGVGAVLAHATPAGERPVAYASRSLTAAERHYAQIDREALAIVFANRARQIPVCHKCGAVDDTLQHTLAVCTGWEEQRRVLTVVVGRDLSLPSLVIAMLGSEGCWKAIASFLIEEVILQKEAVERERENDPLVSSLRRRRRGRKRRLYDRSTLPPGGGQQAGGAGAFSSDPHKGGV
ncbi:uncharacterized protein LOC135086402 [Ostrinia nubilalis]|uniref:uncharacterized protein LOC135086402 n=1 Tax=Ostrinia nubilalis TaxID=29057 RepID=UPI003082444D